MSVYTKIADVKVPDLKVVYGNYKSTVRGNELMIKKILNNYGTEIEKWGNLFEIPKSWLVVLMAIESGGEPVGRNNYGAIGLMQVKEVTVRECISRFKLFTGVNIPTLAYDQIKLKAPYLLKLSAYQQKLDEKDTEDLEKLLIVDTKFNIMMGTICFRISLESTKVGGLARLNKAIISYNTGIYGVVRSKYNNKIVSSLVLYKDRSFTKEAREYLAKSLGAYGFSELYRKI